MKRSTKIKAPTLAEQIAALNSRVYTLETGKGIHNSRITNLELGAQGIGKRYDTLEKFANDTSYRVHHLERVKPKNATMDEGTVRILSNELEKVSAEARVYFLKLMVGDIYGR